MIKHAIRRPGSLEREVCCRAGAHALGVQVSEREDRAGQVVPRDLALVGAVVKPTGHLSFDQRDDELAEVAGSGRLARLVVDHRDGLALFCETQHRLDEAPPVIAV
jgi:hypothetical protein